MLQACWYAFYTECLLSMRKSQAWLFPAGFFVIMIALFPIALTPDSHTLLTLFPGMIWLACLLASMLSVMNIFNDDLEEGQLEQLLLNDIPFSLLLIAKITAHWFTTIMPLILLTPLLAFLFHASGLTIILLCTSLLVGTPALIFIHSFGSALTLGLKQPGVMLGLLILPLTIPILIFGISTVTQSQTNISYYSSLLLLAALSLIAILCLPFAISSVIKIGLDD